MESTLRYQTLLGRVPFIKYGQYCRLVEEDDYEFIYLLRSDKQLGRHLSDTEEGSETQRLWIKEYKLRERSGAEFYFINQDPSNNDRLGVYRLSSFTDVAFSTGSWLFKPGLKSQPILGNIMGKEIGFDILNCEKCIFDVRKENASVLAYHKLFNPVLVREDDLNFYFELSKSSFEGTKNKILKLFGYSSDT